MTVPPTTPRAGPPESTSHPVTGAENATPVVMPVFIQPNASARRWAGAASLIRSVAAASVGAIARPATNSTGISSHGEGSSSTGGSSGISSATPAVAANARRLSRGGPASPPATSPPTREPKDQRAASTPATPGRPISRAQATMTRSTAASPAISSMHTATSSDSSGRSSRDRCRRAWSAVSGPDAGGEARPALRIVRANPPEPATDTAAISSTAPAPPPTPTAAAATSGPRTNTSSWKVDSAAYMAVRVRPEVSRGHSARPTWEAGGVNRPVTRDRGKASHHSAAGSRASATSPAP